MAAFRYGIDLQFDKLDELDRQYPAVHAMFKSDLNNFLDFLGKLINTIEKKE